MSFELFRIQVEAIGPCGETDEFANVVLTEDHLLIDGFFADSVGLSWSELSRLLENPIVQAKLEEADILRTGTSSR